MLLKKDILKSNFHKTEFFKLKITFGNVNISMDTILEEVNRHNNNELYFGIKKLYSMLL